MDMIILWNIVGRFSLVFHFNFSCCWIDNRILENNAILQIQYVKLEKDVNHLRLTNAGLERASEARYIIDDKERILDSFLISSQALANVNNKLSEANEEVIMHLREKGEVSDIKMNESFIFSFFCSFNLACSRSSSFKSCIDGCQWKIY